MDKPKISVIVPVYKAEKYLKRCVDSILAQTFSDFEVLLVDDGSPDSSGEICNEYAAKDSRIRVFHKENGGVSSARNIGLENAWGEWVAFFDADDSVNDELFSKCEVWFDRADIIKYGYYSLSQHGGQSCFAHYEQQVDNLLEWRQKIIARDLIIPAWSAVYRRKLLDSNMIRFDKNISNGEDWLFLSLSFLCAKKIVSIDYCGYNYYIGGPDACSTNLTIDKIQESFTAYRILENEVKNNPDFSYSLNKGYCNLLNYSIHSCLYSAKSVFNYLSVRKEIIAHIPFDRMSFCYTNYSKVYAIRLWLYYHNMFCLFPFLWAQSRRLVSIYKRKIEQKCRK